MTKEDFSKENDTIVVDTCSDEGVEKIIVAIGSLVTTNKEVNKKLKELLELLPEEKQETVEVLMGKNGPVHPLSSAARSVGGWHLAKLKIWKRSLSLLSLTTLDSVDSDRSDMSLKGAKKNTPENVIIREECYA